MRSPTRVRCYVQCSLEDRVEDWSDARFWEEFRRRMGEEIADADHARALDRKEHRAAAQLRGRAVALRPAVSRRGRGAHRAADRRQGPEPRGERRVLPARGAARLLPRAPRRHARRILGALPAAHLEGRALLMVDDPAAAPLSRRRLRRRACRRPSSNTCSNRAPRRPAWPRTTWGCRCRRSVEPGNAVPIALCMAVAVLEGFDIQAMGVAMPRLRRSSASAGAKGWLFSINNIGMVLGAAFGGWLADRVGRKPVLIGAVAMFGLFTLWVVDRAELRDAVTARVSRRPRFRRRAAQHDGHCLGIQPTGAARAHGRAGVLRLADRRRHGGAAHPGVARRTSTGARGSSSAACCPWFCCPALRWLLPETLEPGQRQAPKDRTPIWKALFGDGRAMPTLLLWLTFLPTLLILYLMPQLAADAGGGQGARTRGRAAGLTGVQLRRASRALCCSAGWWIATDPAGR